MWHDCGVTGTTDSTVASEKIVINTLCITASALAMVINFLVALGKLRLVYVLTMCNGCCFIVLNTLIACSGDNQQGVALLVIPFAVCEEHQG